MNNMTLKNKMVRVRETRWNNVYIRDDGWVCMRGENGPWTRGVKLCVNSDQVRQHSRTPKYYFVLPVKRVIYVHRLVALAFCPNPNPAEFTVVDHISGDSLSNSFDGLRWLNHQLNMMNTQGSKNCFKLKRGSKKWRATVTVAGKVYRWGYFKTYRQAHLAALQFKAAKFTEIYRTFIQNETPTTAVAQYIHGRPGPLVLEPEVACAGVLGTGKMWGGAHGSWPNPPPSLDPDGPANLAG